MRRRKPKLSPFAVATAWVGLLLALGSVVASLAFYRHLNRLTPETADWENAAQKIKTHFKEGDRIAVVPFWATANERALVEAGLTVRFLSHVATEEWPGAKRLWVVNAYERFTDAQVLADRGAVLSDTLRAGPLEIRLFQMPPSRGPALLFSERLDEAQVFTLRGLQRRDCGPWEPLTERFPCSRDQDWHYVGLMEQELEDAVRTTIWAHPVTGTQLVIRFEQVEMSQRVVLYHGLTAYAAGEPEGAPVTLAVRVDGREIGRAVHPNVSAWMKDEIPFGGLPGERHDLEISITTPNDGRRHFSFDGFAE